MNVQIKSIKAGVTFYCRTVCTAKTAAKTRSTSKYGPEVIMQAPRVTDAETASVECTVCTQRSTVVGSQAVFAELPFLSLEVNFHW